MINNASELADMLDLPCDDPHLEAMRLYGSNHLKQLTAILVEPIKRFGTAADCDERLLAVADESRDVCSALGTVRKKRRVGPGTV